MDMFFVWVLHPKHQAHQVNGNGPWHATIAVTEVGMLIKLDEGAGVNVLPQLLSKIITRLTGDLGVWQSVY